MAYKNYGKRGRSRITHGKKFRTRAGRYGSYKYVNGKRVGFVSSKKKSRQIGYRRRRY